MYFWSFQKLFYWGSISLFVRVGKMIKESISKEEFLNWFNGLKNQKKPRRCSLIQCQALLSLAFYSGLMSFQLSNLKPEDLTKIKVNGHRFIQIKFKQSKKWKTVLLPENRFTRLAYNYAMKFPPGLFFFHAFQSKMKDVATWEKPVLVRTIENNVIISETIELMKEATPFIRKGSIISRYIKQWTGLPFSSLRKDYKLRVSAKNS